MLGSEVAEPLSPQEQWAQEGLADVVVVAKVGLVLLRLAVEQGRVEEQQAVAEPSAATGRLAFAVLRAGELPRRSP